MIFIEELRIARIYANDTLLICRVVCLSGDRLDSGFAEANPCKEFFEEVVACDNRWVARTNSWQVREQAVVVGSFYKFERIYHAASWKR